MENKEPLFEFCHQVEIGSYKINYVKLGSGPIPIFCFPGLLGSLRHTGSKLLEEIASEDDGKKYTVFTWDPPGYFLSGSPVRKMEDVSFQTEVELSYEFLKCLGYSKWILMGWSAGGQVAIQFTNKYPQMVSKLVVWGTWDFFEDDHLQFHKSHRDIKTMDPGFRADQMLNHGFTYEELNKHWTAWMDMIEAQHFNQDKKKWVEKFEAIQCPVLIVAGSDDALGPVSQAQHLHQHIKTSRLEIIEGAPHWMHVSHLDETLQLFREFLN